MKVIKYTPLVIIVLLLITIASCRTSKNSTNHPKKRSISGVFCTDTMPADIGPPYRLYLKFSNDGTVLSMLSTLECDSLVKIIDKQYGEKATYNIDKKKNLTFVFKGANVTGNQYTASYIGKSSKKELNLTATVVYKNDRGTPNQKNEHYFLCSP